MHTFEQKQVRPHRRTLFNRTGPSATAKNSSRDTYAFLYRQGAVGHQAAAQSSPASARTPEGRTVAVTSDRFAHDFSRIPLSGRVPENVQSKPHRASMELRAGQNSCGLREPAVGPDLMFAQALHEHRQVAGRTTWAQDLTRVGQARFRGAAIQRDEDKPKPGTAGSSPKLTWTPSKKGTPCACLVVVHNEERDAHDTAELMHKHCAYNLALVVPDTGKRRIKLPGHGEKKFDPNALFGRDIAEMCTNDEKACRDFLTKKKGTRDKKEIEKYVGIQFFLAIKDCSKGFSLPVVALHNNDIQDTKKYLQEKKKADLKDLGMDIDKRDEKSGDEQVKRLKKLLKDKFGEDVKKKLTETAGKTNIFRWCASSDLTKCHIGDPDHPDKVIWTTNEKDYQKLSKKDVNVVLQTKVPASKKKKSESEGDLSTLFVILKNIFEQNHFVRLAQLMALQGIGYDVMLLLMIEMATANMRIDSLRYINIETPLQKLKKGKVTKLGGTEREQNFEFIKGALEAVGLLCCGPDSTNAEKNIREGLNPAEKK